MVFKCHTDVDGCVWCAHPKGNLQCHFSRRAIKNVFQHIPALSYDQLRSLQIFHGFQIQTKKFWFTLWALQKPGKWHACGSVDRSADQPNHRYFRWIFMFSLRSLAQQDFKLTIPTDPTGFSVVLWESTPSPIEQREWDAAGTQCRDKHSWRVHSSGISSVSSYRSPPRHCVSWSQHLRWKSSLNGWWFTNVHDKEHW